MKKSGQQKNVKKYGFSLVRCNEKTGLVQTLSKYVLGPYEQAFYHQGIRLAIFNEHLLSFFYQHNIYRIYIYIRIYIFTFVVYTIPVV